MALGQMAGTAHPTGGLDTAALDTGSAGPMVGEIVAADVQHGLVVATRLDPAEQLFLDHHRIDGTPVLPGVMGIEAFAEVARLLAPDRYVVAVEDIDFLAPLKFYRDEPRTVTVTALLRPDGPDLLAECQLTAERALPGSDVPQRTVHFTGSVRLSTDAPEPESEAPVAHAEGTPVVSREEVYRLYFHGPAYQVVAEGWRHHGAAATRLATDLPANHEPAGQPTVIGPRLVELVFQTAGLWEAGRAGRMALPAHVGRVRLFGAHPPTEESGALVAVAGESVRDAQTPAGFDCAVLDGDGRVVLRVEDYRTVPLPAALPDEVRAPLHAVMADLE